MQTIKNKEPRVLEEETPRENKVRNLNVKIKGNATSVDLAHENHKPESQRESSCASSVGNQTNTYQTPPPPYILSDSGKTVEAGGASSAVKFETKTIKKPSARVSEQGHIEVDKKAQAAEESNGIANMGIMKMMSLKKSVRVMRQDAWELNGDGQKKPKVIPVKGLLKLSFILLYE